AGLSVTSGSVGANVGIVGSGFSKATRVLVGAASTPFKVINDNLVTASAPANPPGVVDIQVSSSAGTSPISPADQFTYVLAPVPVITGISLGTGTGADSPLLTVLGSGFTGATQVSFGGTPATALNVVA